MAISVEGAVEVSVVIVNYNTYEFTVQCIKSIIENTRELDYEIIVVDNASSEIDPVNFKNIFPTVKLICSTRNLGFSGGNNLGIKEASGKIILLLNSDTKLINNAIKLSYDRMIADTGIGVLSAKLYYADNTVQPVGGRFPSLKREIRNVLRLNKRLSDQEKANYFLGPAFDHLSEKQVDWVWGSFFMFRRETLNIFPDKLLPEDYFMYGEDLMWCYYIKKAGYKIIYYPKGEAYHYVAGSDADNQLNDFRRYTVKMLPNEYDFIRKAKGLIYARLYYFIKALIYFTQTNITEYRKGVVYLKVAVRGL